MVPVTVSIVALVGAGCVKVILVVGMIAPVRIMPPFYATLLPSAIQMDNRVCNEQGKTYGEYIQLIMC